VSDKPSSRPKEDLNLYMEALENTLVGIHGFVSGALARQETMDDDEAREAFSHIQALVERVLPEVLKIKEMMEEAGGEPPLVH
jgi:hypothetical protein